ncbi:MAG: DUF5615 family PIN-like protein [Planctomycetota bacterium]
MTVWVDAHLSQALAPWLARTFGVKAVHLRELGLRDAKDFPIFQAARIAKAVVLTKDADFPHLVPQHGQPPQVLWLTCGNTSNANLRRILTEALPQALQMLAAGEAVVEIR